MAILKAMQEGASFVLGKCMYSEASMYNTKTCMGKMYHFRKSRNELVLSLFAGKQIEGPMALDFEK